MVRASDLRMNSPEFYLRSLHYRSVSTGMGDRLQAGIPSRYVISHPGQLNLLPSMGREISTGQTCGDALRLGNKSRMVYSIRG